jgi:hypothetical protein
MLMSLKKKLLFEPKALSKASVSESPGSEGRAERKKGAAVKGDVCAFTAFQRAIPFDRRTEEGRQNNLTKLTKVIEAQTAVITELIDTPKPKQDGNSPDSDSKNDIDNHQA